MRSVQQIIGSLATQLRLPYSDVHTFFLGGGDTSRDLMALLDSQGYDTAGDWLENQAWYKTHGVTKAEFNRLVRACR